MRYLGPSIARPASRALTCSRPPSAVPGTTAPTPRCTATSSSACARWTKHLKISPWPAVRGAAQVRKVFVMDGDALAMDLDHWEPILGTLHLTFPNLRRVSCYATAMNLLEKSQVELERLRDLGLKLLYIGPESGDDVTLRRIAKGATAADHVEAAVKARQAGIKQSLILLLGAGRHRPQRGARRGFGPARHGHGSRIPVRLDPDARSVRAHFHAGGTETLRASADRGPVE